MWCSSFRDQVTNAPTQSYVLSPDPILQSSPSPFPTLERVYDGAVGGFLTETSRFYLRIEADGSVRGEIRPKRPNERTISIKGQKKRKRRDDIVLAHIIGTASIVPILSSSTINCEQHAAEYCCTFEVMKRLHHVDRHTLTCHLHVPMAPDVPAVGTWSGCHQQVGSTTIITDNNFIKNEATEPLRKANNIFQLKPVTRHQEAASGHASRLYPLRPGTYEFRGFTTNHRRSRPRNGRRARPLTSVKDQCLVTLQLLADGTLRGTSREVVQPQVCELRGRWQEDRVTYAMEYRVREAVGHFRYSGAIMREEEGGNGKKSRVTGAEATGTKHRREVLCGKWYNIDKGHAEGYAGGRGEFELELVRTDFAPITMHSPRETSLSLNPLQEPSLNPESDGICALTCGEYELSGCATDADGYEYTFDLTLQLQPGGKLVGESKERIFQQTTSVYGHWEPRRIVYVQHYIVHQEVGVYMYTADLVHNGAAVEGTWVNTEPDAVTASSEHGTFAMIVVKSTRRWSPCSHLQYPARFRQGVLTTLMTSARVSTLPGALWTHVFSFCDETWFTPTR